MAWVGKGALAVLDQGLISGSNFLTGILLARWLAPEAYGAYGFAFAIFLLLSLVHQALILEPMSVFGPSQYRNCQREYLGSLLWIHGGLALPTAFVLGTAAWVAHEAARSPGLPGALAGVTFAAPCVLLFWLVRRAFYVKLAPQGAAMGALFYSTVVLGGLWVVYQRGVLSPFSVFLLMGLGALAASGLQLFRLRPTMKPRLGNPSLSAVGHEHWDYGRWVLAAAVASWVPWNIQYALLSASSGMAAAGQLRALLNLTLPVAQGLEPLFLLSLPYASGVYSARGVRGVEGLTRRLTVLFTCAAIAYWAVVVALRKPILLFLYAGKYTEIGSLIPWIALASLFRSAGYGPMVALRAVQSPASTFVACCLSGLFALAVGIPVMRALGVSGAVLSIIASSAVVPVAASLMLHRKTSFARQ
jgi:O-antigen/teichoic acid export membrane protein